MQEPPQFTLKLVMLGDAGTGKTSLSSRFTKNTFDPEYKSTDRLQFSSKEFSFKNVRLKAQIWDTAGKDRPEGMTRAFFKDAAGAIQIYNVNSQESFDNIQKTWIPQMTAFGQPTMPMILVANKVDNGTAPQRVVSSEAGIALAHEHSCSYLEVSAMSDYNVECMFRRLIFSVASVLPGIRAAMNTDALPLGWLALSRDSSGKEEYCNYWTGKTTTEPPTQPALAYETGKGEIDTFVKLEMNFRDSFCSKIMEDAGNNDIDRMSGHLSNRDSSSKPNIGSNPGTFEDIEKKEGSGGGLGCGERCTVS